jgi:hypothetical protein
LIARAVAEHPLVVRALKSGTVAIIAGTTNGYIAEEVLSSIDQKKGFSRKNFFRGVVLPPGQTAAEKGEKSFPGDVIIKNGIWQRGATIFDVVDDLKEGDIILKGANAVNVQDRQAAIYIGDPHGGTIGTALQAVVGRRVQLILPVGLEKRVLTHLNELALELNAPDAEGPRLLPVPGEVLTELDALLQLTGLKAELIAGGGVGGAEGSIWLGVRGEDQEMEKTAELLTAVSSEKPFEF